LFADNVAVCAAQLAVVAWSAGSPRA